MKSKIWLIIMAVGYFAIALAICLFKYFTFMYNAMDLGIFNQVFYNTSQGNWFGLTIHSTSYLGDHFTPIIIFLLPFYYIYRSPINLLIIQTLFLALSVIPIYLIAKDKLSHGKILFVSALFLFNPITLSINLFEFHLLPLVIFFGLWAFYFYDKKKIGLFILFCLLCLMVNEDVSFIIFSFGLLALLERRQLKWILTPMIMSVVYFFSAIKIISIFATDGASKFLMYYGWLGSSMGEIAVNFFLKFPQVLEHYFSDKIFLTLLGLLLAFLFLPLLKPKYLILCLPSFLEFTLPNSMVNLLSYHYAAPFVLVFTLGSIFALRDLKYKWFIKYQPLALMIGIISIIYLQAVLGPFALIYQEISNQSLFGEVTIKKELIEKIPNDASVVTSYALLPNLSGRKKIYMLNYIFIGVQQYSKKPYEHEIADYALIDFNDFIDFQLQYKNTSLYDYSRGEKNFSNFIKNYQILEADKTVVLFKKSEKIDDELYTKLRELPNIKNSLTGEFEGYLQTDKLLSVQPIIF